MTARAQKVGIGGLAIAAALVVLPAVGIATSAEAQALRRPVVSAGEAARAAEVAPAHRALRLDRSGRWSVDFSLNPSSADPQRVGDVGAGAYFSVNPRLRVGASAGLVEEPVDPARRDGAERPSTPRVRLESTFRF